MTAADRAFAAAFRDTSLTTDAFHHRDHVRMAWIYVREFGADATGRFAEDLQRFARAKGVPGLYHATITTAYLALVAERDALTPSESWDTFAAAHPDLLTWKPGVLDRYYSAERLASPVARRQFVLPDRVSLDVAAR
ncbi:MAG: hypothetical protein R2708_19735 [Vicinamibacterales bacterium]